MARAPGPSVLTRLDGRVGAAAQGNIAGRLRDPESAYNPRPPCRPHRLAARKNRTADHQQRSRWASSSAALSPRRAAGQLDRPAVGA